MKRHLLVIRFSSLGDVVLTSATVLNLKLLYPDSRLVFLTKAAYQPIVKLFGCVDEIVTLPQPCGGRDYFNFLLDLDERQFDTVIDLHGSIRSWLARKIVTAGAKTVYPKRRWERLQIVRKHHLLLVWPHTIDLYNDCVEQLGGIALCRRPVINAPGTTTSPPNKLSATSDPGRQVVIAPGAAHPNKQWLLERFAEVATTLHRSHGVAIIWAITAADRGKVSLAERIDPRHFVELVDCPITDLAAVLEKADLTIANDSGVAHLSSAVGTPVLSLFGPTHPALGFAPRGLFDRVVEVEESCRPCSLHGKKPCYRSERFCFTRISPEMVSEMAGELLDVAVNSARALFVDRDGTIIVEKEFLADPDEIEFESGAIDALRKAQAMGFKLVILSNQSGVARGRFGLDTVERVNERLLSMLAAAGVEIAGLYYCPHYAGGVVEEFATRCRCRKPAPAMAEEAARQLGINLRRSYVIGDKADDVNLGRVIGARAFLVETGHGRNQEPLLSTGSERVTVCDNLAAAVERIRKLERQ
ncbi:MAG: HAD-IIIA family hydrolase [bacterium]